MLDVGRIVARVEAETADFDKKMEGAARTFDATQNRINASAQKAYTERITAANRAANQEIAVARRVLNERIRLSQSSTEIAALKAQFEQRIATARAGAQREVQAAQQAYLAARQGALPAVQAVTQLGTAATRTSAGLNAVRASVTSMASSAISAAPGVGQLASALGVMAIGTPKVIGILAGLAAVAIAVERIGRKWREAAKETKDSIDALLAAGSKRADPTGVLEDLNNARKRQAVLIQSLARLSQPAFDPALLRQGIQQQLPVDAEAVRSVLAELQRVNLAIREGERQVVDWGGSLKESADKGTEAIERLNKEMRKFDIDRLRVGGGAGQSVIPEIEMLNNVRRRSESAIARAAQAAALGAQGGFTGGGEPELPPRNFWGNLGDTIKDRLDPKQFFTGIATNLATSGVNAIIGALGNAVAGVLDFGKAAREAARQLRRVQEETAQTLEEWIGSLQQQLGSPEAQASFNAAERVRQAFEQFSQAFQLGGFQIPQLPDIDAVIKWLRDAIEQSGPAMTAEAVAALRNILKGAELEKELLKLSDAASKVSESLTNVPQGFKVALARFNATAGVTVPAPFMPGPPRSGLNVPSPASPGGSAPPWSGRVINIERIEVHGVQDGPALLAAIEREADAAAARGGSSVSAYWSPR